VGNAENDRESLISKKNGNAREENKVSEKEEGEVTSEDDKEANDVQKQDAEEYDEVIIWEDTDDYLIYLEDVLKRIHAAYYEMYDQMKKKQSSEIPDMKRIIPYVRKKVLQGVNILFSGVIPMNQPPEKSRAYNVARSLGANIHTTFIPQDDSKKGGATTHLVAAKVGTAKVIQAKKHKNVHVVNPDWLWTCTERWEWVEERLFQLTDDNLYPFADSPDPWKPKKGKKSKDTTAKNCNEKNKEKFQDYNPLYALSTSDIQQMGDEVDEIFDESESEDSDSELRRVVLGFGKKRPRESSSEESMTAEFPKGWGKKKRNLSAEPVDCEDTDIANPEEEGMDEDENEVQRKIVENPDSLLGHSDQSSNNSSDFHESIGSVDDEMAAALEREFLSY
jgi:RNA polymerase II subunit A-like phosphatase